MAEQGLKTVGFILITIVCGLHFVTAMLGSPTTDTIRERTISSLQTFIKAIQLEKPFDTLVIFRSEIEQENIECAIVDLLPELQWPVVLINPNTTYEYREKFPNEILLVSCVQEQFLQELKPFPVRTNIRVLLIFTEVLKNCTSKFDVYCKSTPEHQILNILALGSDFGIEQNYLSCRYITGSGILEHTFNTNTRIIYADRLRDMMGAPLRTQEDFLDPRTMLYIDEQGKRQVTGYVFKLMQTFLHKHNATLSRFYELTDGKTIFYKEIQNLTRMAMIDIGCNLIPALGLSNMNELTYPYELINFCYMIPISSDVPIYEIFTRVVKPNIFLVLVTLVIIFGALLTWRPQCRMDLINALLNDKSFRGILGQSFPVSENLSVRLKFVFMLICYTSIMVNTMYVAYLQAFLTEPPKLPTIQTYDDVAATDLKILMPRAEMAFIEKIPNPQLVRYKHLFELIDMNDFIEIRGKLNTRYIYPVISQRWTVFAEQQKLFKKKIFFRSNDFCIKKFMYMSMPIRNNSYYRDAMERLILQIQDSGLLSLWLSFSFYDMVRIGRMNLEDLSEDTPSGGPLRVYDFYWIWCLYFFGIGGAALVFLGEKLGTWWRRRNEVKNLYKKNFVWMD